MGDYIYGDGHYDQDDDNGDESDDLRVMQPSEVMKFMDNLAYAQCLDHYILLTILFFIWHFLDASVWPM